MNKSIVMTVKVTSTPSVNVPKNSTTHIINNSTIPTKTKDNPTEKNESIGSVIALVTTALIVLLLLIIIVVVTFFVIRRNRARVVTFFVIRKNRARVKSNIELDDKAQNREVESSNTLNDNCLPPNVNTLEISNPSYIHQSRKKTTTTETGGIYSLVTTDNMHNEEKGGNVTKTVTTDGQVITGAYNVVTPLTPPPVRSASEIIESAAYACIKANSDQAYAAPVELDHTRGKKKKPSAQEHSAQGIAYAALSDATVGEPDNRPRMYTGIQVKELPAVPNKSSDLLQYLDTQSALNVSIYTESINHLDFTRNRKEGRSNNPQYLGPIYTAASVLPESYQDPAEVTSENISEKMKLGTGQFGEVVLANTKSLSLKSMRMSKTDNKRNISITVAVKKLQSNPSQTQREAFDKEAQFMSHIKHPNVLRLLGVCHHNPAFIMMEFTDGGDLNQFLQSYAEIVTTSSNQTQMTSSELVYIASQIASGMQYLASLKFVHRDLATRNCFIGTNNSIKVGDVGVNTSIYQSSYYRIRGNRMMPIRWMATECFSGKFSEKSDVWAFGVTMWELFTLAKDLPYPHLSNEEVIHNALKREYRQFPVKPVVCPQQVYEVMERCWAVDMRHRPTFQKLVGLFDF